MEKGIIVFRYSKLIYILTKNISWIKKLNMKKYWFDIIVRF